MDSKPYSKTAGLQSLSRCVGSTTVSTIALFCYLNAEKEYSNTMVTNTKKKDSNQMASVIACMRKGRWN